MRGAAIRILALFATAAGAATLATDHAAAPVPMSQPTLEAGPASATQSPAPACTVRTGEADFRPGHVPADARLSTSPVGAPTPFETRLRLTSPSALLPPAWEEPNSLLPPTQANRAKGGTAAADPNQPLDADLRRLVVPGLGSVILVLVGVALATRRGGPVPERAVRVPAHPSCAATDRETDDSQPEAANPEPSAERD